MDRRSFLTTSAAAPILLGMTKKAHAAHPVIGVDGHKYECHHGWGETPGGFEWQTTHGIAIDAAGQVYVTHQGVGKKVMDTVVVFDPKGKFVRSFGKQWHQGGHGIDVREEGNEEFLYLSHMSPNGPVVKTTPAGEVVWSKGRPETPEYQDPKAVYKPTNVAFAPDGGFYIADGYGLHTIQKFDPAGKLLATFGGAGKGDGRFNTPHGLWIDPRDPNHPVLVVCDRGNHRLQWFDPDGKFLKATKADEAVLFPAHIDTRGDVMLVPDLFARVSLFGKDNTVIAHLGDDEGWRKKVLDGFKVRRDARQWEDGKFVHPHDACFDKDGNIYVAEWVEGGRITFLKKVG